MDKMLKPSKVREILDVSLATVYRMVASGDLKAIRVRQRLRIPASEIDRLREEGRLR